MQLISTNINHFVNIRVRFFIYGLYGMMLNLNY